MNLNVRPHNLLVAGLVFFVGTFVFSWLVAALVIVTGGFMGIAEFLAVVILSLVAAILVYVRGVTSE